MVCAFRGPQRSPETNTQGQNTDGTVQDEVTWLSRQFRGYQPWRRGDTLSLSNGRDDWPEMETHSKSGKKRNRPPRPRRKCASKKKKSEETAPHPCFVHPHGEERPEGAQPRGSGQAWVTRGASGRSPHVTPSCERPALPPSGGDRGPGVGRPSGSPGKERGLPRAAVPPGPVSRGPGSLAAVLPDQEDTLSSMSLFPTRDVPEGDKR